MKTNQKKIPDGWKFEDLGSVAVFRDPERVPISSSERETRKGEYPYYGASGIIDYVNDYLFDGDFVLLGEDGANILDRSSRLAYIASGKIWVNNHAHVLEPKENILLYFLSEYLEKLDYKMYNTGSAQPKLNRAVCEKIPVLLPPLPEQNRIVTVLETWDSGIKKLKQKIAIKKEIKKGLMQELLTGKKRLPGFSNEWKEKKLGEISTITTGSSNREDSSLDGKFTFFDRSEDVRTSNIYLFDGEAVIVAGEGQRFIPKYFVGKFDLHQRTYAIMDFEETDSKYIYYYLYQNKNYLLSQAVGSTVKSLRLPMFTKMEILIPEYKEQKAIAEILTIADDEITSLEKKLTLWQEQKKYLLNNLVTGQIRTPENLLEINHK